MRRRAADRPRQLFGHTNPRLASHAPEEEKLTRQRVARDGLTCLAYARLTSSAGAGRAPARGRPWVDEPLSLNAGAMPGICGRVRANRSTRGLRRVSSQNLRQTWTEIHACETREHAYADRYASSRLVWARPLSRPRSLRRGHGVQSNHGHPRGLKLAHRASSNKTNVPRWL